MARKRKLTKIEKFGLICMAAIAVFYGYLKMVYDPASQDFEEKRTRHAELTEEVAAYESTPSLSGLKSKVADLEQEENTLGAELDVYMAEGKMETQEEVTETLVDIHRLALRHSLGVVQILRTGGLDSSGKEAATERDESTEKEEKAEKDGSPEAAEDSDAAVSGFNWHRYEMTFSGSYANLTGFVQNLETLDAYVYIQYVLIEYDENKGLYQMKIVLLI